MLNHLKKLQISNPENKLQENSKIMLNNESSFPVFAPIFFIMVLESISPGFPR